MTNSSVFESKVAVVSKPATLDPCCMRTHESAVGQDTVVSVPESATHSKLGCR